MIICHPLKLIFFKTKKTGGTSFEIALSEHCGPECVITPISPDDEASRAALGLPGAQNYDRQVWPDGAQGTHSFFNHISAREARAKIPAEIWNSYRKITILRDPFDAAISRYFWEGADKAGLDFTAFISRFRWALSENTDIAPLSGPCAMDHYLRYEHLEADITALNIPGLWDRFSTIKAKSIFRPKAGADRNSVLADHPKAADIIAEECGDVIARFGYQRPVPAMARPARPNAPRAHVFTLTAGRTGTGWLAQLLGDNLGLPARHVADQPEDFGTRTPDIRIMRSFNQYGLVQAVRTFWDRKLDALGEAHTAHTAQAADTGHTPHNAHTPHATYAETNHTLAKCGLIEALAHSELADSTRVIVLRRNLLDQCASYIHRHDFSHDTVAWQWYLHPDYRNNMITPKPFLPLGAVGKAIWYSFEMAARQEYYLRKYRDRVQFIEADLHEITQPEGAAALLAQLGGAGRVRLPKPTNACQAQPGERAALKAELKPVMEQFGFDAGALADAYIGAGRQLTVPA